MRHWMWTAMLAICGMGLMTPSGTRAVQAPDAAAVVRELYGATMSNGHRLPYEQVDYKRLAAALPEGLEISRKSASLWQHVSTDAFPGATSVPLFFALDSALRNASAAAPSAVEKERWLREMYDLRVRFLRDAETRRIYAEKRDGNSDSSPFATVSRVIAGGPSDVRRMLWLRRQLQPDDWVFQYELNWLDEPGMVLVRDGVAFVNVAALQKGGIAAREGGGAVAVVHGDRRASIPVGTEQQAGARRGFRDRNGRVYVPAMELDRQRVHEVYVLTEGQVVQVRPGPPPTH